MTNTEAVVLDKLWTDATPEIDTSRLGFVTRLGSFMVSLDPESAAYVQAKAEETRRSPSEIIGELIRKELSATVLEKTDTIR
jgi:hypothetical protein